MPSETDLERRFGYDRGTIRKALFVLRNEGLVTVEHGRGARVRSQRLVTRDIAAGLRQEYAAIDSGISDTVGVFRTLTGVDGEVDVQTEYEWATATPDLAEAFGLAAGAPLLRRRYPYKLDGEPYQLVDSYLPGQLVKGTILESKEQESPGRGTMRQLADIGVRVDYAEVRIQARTPTPEEASALVVPEGVPVFVTRRLMFADHQVVEVSDTIVPGDRLELLIGVDLKAGRP